MNLSDFSTAQIIVAIVTVAILLAAGIGISYSMRKRRTNKLRTQFGSTEYARAVNEGGSQRKAEAALDKRAERVDALRIHPLAAADRARFIESWARIESRFIDAPGGAVIDADKLLGDVMSTRGYPMSD